MLSNMQPLHEVHSDVTARRQEEHVLVGRRRRVALSARQFVAQHACHSQASLAGWLWLDGDIM